MGSFLKVAAAVPKVKVADVRQNVFEILRLIEAADEKEVDLLVFPQLSITGYTPGDIFFQELLIIKAQEGLFKILDETKNLRMTIILGLPVMTKSGLINMAVFCKKGEILKLIPNFDGDGRYFISKNTYDLTKNSLKNIEENDPCFSLYNPDFTKTSFVSIESSNKEMVEIGLGFNLDMDSQSGDINIIMDGKFADYQGEIAKERKIKNLSKNSAVIYINPGMFESTTDGVMSGHVFVALGGEIIKKDNNIIAEEKLVVSNIDIKNLISLKKPRIKSTDLFNEEEKQVLKNPFLSSGVKEKNNELSRIFEIQTAGLIKRMDHIKTKKAIVAVSGGLDSTLALLVVENAFRKMGYDKSGIIGISMPGFGTSRRTYDNGNLLMEGLGITKKEISIVSATKQHFLDIGHNFEKKDTTFENAQARERTQIAMDVANMEGGLVVGTGDLSELVLGFTTYNGDHMSMYSVNSGLVKTLVRAVTKHLAKSEDYREVKDVLLDIVNTPVSPELLPTKKDGSIQQVTEDILGPYELNDFFIFYSLCYGYTPRKILELAFLAFEGEYKKKDILKYLKNYYKRFFSQQFKRSCMPDGVSVSSMSVSPRTGLKMPSDALASLWTEEIEEIEKE